LAARVTVEQHMSDITRIPNVLKFRVEM